MTAAAVAATLAVSPAVGAGGWAVTTLDSMVVAPVAGEDVAVGFTIRQHGETPVAVDDVAIVVTDDAGDTTRFAAEPEGPVGHYVATMRLPAEGTYEWSVEQGWFGPQELGTLDVTGAESGAAGGGGSDFSPLTVPIAVLAAALIGAGLVGFRRTSVGRTPA